MVLLVCTTGDVILHSVLCSCALTFLPLLTIVLGDAYPTIFRKDILAHEAHRHPFLELLGTMYMMKIRHDEKFVNRAGYSFRLVFTVALMPWVRKYRVLARPNSFKTKNKESAEEGQPKDHQLLPPSSNTHSQATEQSELESENERLRAEVERLRQELADKNDKKMGDESSITVDENEEEVETMVRLEKGDEAAKSLC